MEDIAPILYIVGLVALYLYRAYKKATSKDGKASRKKARRPIPESVPQNLPREEKRPTDTYDESRIPQRPEPAKEFKLEEIFEELFEEKVEDIIMEEPIIQYEQPEIPSKEFFKFDKPKERSIDIKLKSAEVVAMNTIKSRKRSSARRKFNLRDAIIMQAILERPYK